MFMADLLGMVVPGNDVMSAIASLFIEVLSYGALIFFFIVFLLCHVIDRFTFIGYSASSDSLSFQNTFIGSLPTFLVRMICIERYREVAYPVYFSKRQESVLDAAFLVIPTILVAIMLVPALGFLYTSDFHFAQAQNASFISIDIIGHQ